MSLQAIELFDPTINFLGLCELIKLALSKKLNLVQKIFGLLQRAIVQYLITGETVPPVYQYSFSQAQPSDQALIALGVS
jgi:hypothetical protein